jgi:hypothetical protein
LPAAAFFSAEPAGDLDGLAGGDLDGLAGGGVAALAGSAVDLLEGQEAGDRDLLVALGDGVGHDGLERLEGGVDVLGGDAGGLGDGVHELVAVQGCSSGQ